MEFKIRKDEFLRGLYLASGIADRKSTLPILANVLIRTEGKDKILCGATDLNVTTIVSLSAKVEKEGGLTVSARQLYEIVKGLPDDEVRVRRTDQNWAEIKAGPGRVQGRRHVRPRLPEAAGDPGGGDVQGRVGRAARHDRQDDLLRVAGRHAPAPGRRAVRIGRRDGAHGVDRRPPAVQGDAPAAGRAEAGDRRAHPAQGRHRAAARDRDARGAERDRHPRRQLRAQGRRRRHLGQADRRAVPALRPGHPQGQRPRVRRVARGAAGRAQARRADVVRQDVRRPAGPREGEAPHRERQPRPRRRQGRDRHPGVQGVAGPDRLQRPLLHRPARPRSRRRRCASSCRASWIRRSFARAEGDYVCVVMPMRL